MAIASTVLLPDQPAAGGGTKFTPFGGDGTQAPLGCYDVDMHLVGDASGGNAVLTIGFDPRFTSMLVYVLAHVIADTAAGEYQLQLFDNDTALPNIRVIGTLPGVAETFVSVNSAYLWSPPPIFMAGAGRIGASFPNVDVTETYGIAASIFVFNRDVRQISPMQFLNMSRVGINAPVSS